MLTHKIRMSRAVLAAAMTAVVPATAGAAQPALYINGNASSVPTTERANQLFVPTSELFGKLGVKVRSSSSGALVATKNGADIASFKLGSTGGTVGGASRELSAAPYTSAGVVYAPLRAISEAAGARVSYESSPRSVRIDGTSAKPVVVAQAPAAATSVATDAATAAATDTATATTADQQQGIPWWVWLLLALLLLGLLAFFLTRKKKDPIIVTRGSTPPDDPNIRTR